MAQGTDKDVVGAKRLLSFPLSIQSLIKFILSTHRSSELKYSKVNFLLQTEFSSALQ